MKAQMVALLFGVLVAAVPTSTLAQSETIELTAKGLHEAFLADSASATEEYGGRTVVITGRAMTNDRDRLPIGDARRWVTCVAGEEQRFPNIGDRDAVRVLGTVQGLSQFGSVELEPCSLEAVGDAVTGQTATFERSNRLLSFGMILFIAAFASAGGLAAYRAVARRDVALAAYLPFHAVALATLYYFFGKLNEPQWNGDGGLELAIWPLVWLVTLSGG